MTPDELLDAAADEMTIRGSATGTLKNLKGEVCMIGAVQEAYLAAGMRVPSGLEKKYDVHRDAMEALIESINPPQRYPNSLAGWSDYHTHDERIEALRQGAKYYREHSQQEAL